MMHHMTSGMTLLWEPRVAGGCRSASGGRRAGQVFRLSAMDKLLIIAMGCVTSICFVLAQPEEGVCGDNADRHDGRPSRRESGRPGGVAHFIAKHC